MSGWPEQPTTEEMKPYFLKRNEITAEEGCLLWGIRVIIPRCFHEQVLTELHAGHPGVVRMKSLARLHVWWPHVDESVAHVVRNCSNCQSELHAGTIVFVGLAQCAVAKAAYRFRRSIHGQNVFTSN